LNTAERNYFENIIDCRDDITYKHIAAADIKNDTLILRAIATTYKARPADEVAAELATQQSQAQGNSENGQANSEQK